MWIPLLLAAAAASPDLTTIAERSGDLRTGRYEEVVALCADFERAFPGKARCTRFGTTPEGRPMLALVASDDGLLDAESARRERRPVLLFQGGIHAGEIDGRLDQGTAGLTVQRDLHVGAHLDRMADARRVLPRQVVGEAEHHVGLARHHARLQRRQRLARGHTPRLAAGGVGDDEDRPAVFLHHHDLPGEAEAFLAPVEIARIEEMAQRQHHLHDRIRADQRDADPFVGRSARFRGILP